MNVLYKLSMYLYKNCGYANRKRDHRGLTIVELVCAIAILTLVGAGVSGVLVVSANTYRNGTTEVGLQTEAQLAVNQIGDLVIDTTATVTGTPDPAASSTINVEQSDRRYVVAHDAAGSQLLYSEYRLEADGAAIPVAEGQLLAENVTEFEADVSDFSSSGSLRLYMKLEKGTKSYAAYYTITARNGRYTVTGGGVAAAATVVAPNEIVVEPNQDFVLNATVVGISNTAVTWTLSNNSDGNTQILVNELGQYYLHVGRNETSNAMVLTASTVAMDGASPLAFTTVNVRLRRVNELKLNGVLISGEGMKAGATYRITPEFVGTTLQRLLGSDSDMDYVDPYNFTWLNVVLDNADGSPNEYFNFSIAPNGEYADLTLKKDLENAEVTVLARALHPDGVSGGTQTNKTGMSYAEVIGEWKLAGGFKIEVSNGGFARGGYSDVLLQNVLDDWINWDIEYDYTQWDYENNDFVKNKGSKNHNYIDLKFYVFKYWAYDHEFDVWVEGGHNNMAATGDEAQRFFDTNVGFKTTVIPGDSLDLAEYLSYDFYSYSTPYYVGMFDTSISKIKMELTLYETNYAGGPSHVASVILEVPEVAFQFRNSVPSDSEGAWSPRDGAQVIYVTPEDHMPNDIYTSYFQLLDGWSSDNNDYVAYNRFVGVIKDEAGYENDVRHDLTFVNSAGNECPRPLPTGKWEIYGDQYYEGWGILQNNGNLNRQEISSGSNGNCTVSVKISEEERKTLAAGSGTVIKEIYEYNYLFGTEALKQWYGDTSYPVWDMYNAVDGCDGYLEYHFVQPNVRITNHVGNEPLVMYCPTGAQAGLVNGFYYMDETHRYQVSGTTANYQVNSGSGFTTQYTLTWDSASQMWHD